MYIYELWEHTTYSFRVKAVKNGLEGPYSYPITKYTVKVPSAPLSLSASSYDYSQSMSLYL